MCPLERKRKGGGRQAGLKSRSLAPVSCGRRVAPLQAQRQDAWSTGLIEWESGGRGKNLITTMRGHNR
jgi:hypothetical protein